MRIERLVIGGFGLFNRTITVDFGDAPFVVLVGDNESGKTTIMDAIVATIFGFAKAPDEEARRPWAEHDLYSCAVVLRMDDSSLVEIGRNFQSNDVRVRQVNGDEKTTIFSGKASPRSTSADARRYAALIEEKVTIGEPSLFYASVFVRQEQMATEFSDRMRRVVSGSVGTDYEKALKALRERFFEVTKNNPWDARDKRKERDIEKFEKRKDETLQELNSQQAGESKFNELVRQRGQQEEEIETLKREIEEGRRALENVARLNRLKEERDRLRENETALRRELETLRDTRRRIIDIKKDLTEKYPDFDSAGMPFQQKLALSSELEDETKRREQALSVEEGRLEAALSKERRIVGLILSAASAIAIAVLGFQTIGGAGGAVGLLVGVALGYLLSRFVPSVPGGKPARARTRLSMLHEQLEEIRERRDQVVNEIVALCGTSDVAAISGQFEEYRALKTQLGRAEDDVGRSRSEQEIQDEHHKTVQELAVTQTRIEQLLEAATTLRQLGDDLQEALALETTLRTTHEQKAADLDSAQEHLIELKTEVAQQTAAGLHDRASLEERLEEIERELARLSLRRDALKCAVDVLTEAIAAYRTDYLPRLEREITELFSQVVGKRYSRVHFDKSLEPRVDAPDRADIPPDALSTGARDQLYLAMRLAFARQLSQREGLPLILDDPFVNFDEHRLAAVQSILKTASAEQQIILFAHDRKFSTWADRVIDLNEMGRK